VCSSDLAAAELRDKLVELKKISEDL